MEAFKEYLKLRGTLYHLLAFGFYREPDPAYIEDLKAHLPVFETIHDGFPESSFKEGIAFLRRFIEIAETDMEGTVSDYERHFAFVFLSPGFPEGRKSIVPHESVYLSARGWAMQEQRDEVLACFFNEGIAKEPDFKEPEDHISAQMHFLSLLSRQTCDALMTDDEDLAMEKIESQLHFLEDHLMRWVPRVCDDLFNAGDFTIYKALAKLTAGFVEIDHRFLAELLNNETP